MTTFISYEELTNQRIGGLGQTDWVVIGPEEDSTVMLMEAARDSSEQTAIGEIHLYHPFVTEDGIRLSLEELLLDERYADGFLGMPVWMLQEVGFLNEKIRGKHRYELLLRLAERYPVIGKRLPDTACGMEKWEMDQPEAASIEAQQGAYRDDCYIVGKYSQLLRECGYFDTVVEGLLQQAESFPDAKNSIAWLEEMLCHGEWYYRILDATAPVLLYYGVTYCYNILNTMLDGLRSALKHQGVRVITYDEQKEDVAGLSRFAGCRFRAVIGVQSYLMSVYMKQSGRFLHDKIIGPKFNLILDHPIWLKNQLMHVPDSYYVLTHDRNYADFIRRYYPQVAGTFLFPPGGCAWSDQKPAPERCYDVVFIGTYGDYRSKCEVMHQSRREVRFLANHFLFHMRTNTEDTAEAAFYRALRDYELTYTDAEFLDVFFEFRSVIQCVMYYYREKVIRTLLEQGIAVDVWGTSWRNAPFADHPYLTIHEDVTPKESLMVLAKAKIGLNIMAWHKGGFTERMANTMMQGAVLVTDRTSYQEYGLTAGRECVMFSLRELKHLPGQIREFLTDEKRRTAIAEAGRQYAQAHHSWDSRARQLLDILEKL